MLRKMSVIFLASVLLALSAPVLSEEGMWQMDKFDSVLFKRMQALGLELSQEQIYAPGGKGIAYAIVELGGGTASFVSPDGLLLTNHHVAFTALQRASTEENNLIAEGFYSDAHEKDIPAEGYEARVLVSIEDVTGKVLKAAEGKSGAERYKAIEQKIKEIETKAEKATDLRCEVAGFFEGMEYKLFSYFLIKDIRLVYAPPRAIGNYGGDIDNWMWPRHTGDFSFFRAYVAPDGATAEYSADNVPYRPAVHLAFSSRGIKDGEYTMIMGFPGRTMRYRTSYSIDYNESWGYPERIRLFGDILDIYKKASENNPGVAIKVASYDQMLNNSMKNNEGLLEGFRKASLLDKKIEQEKDFTDWIDSDKGRRKKYGDVLPSLARLYEEQKSYRDKSLLGRFVNFGCQMMRAATVIVRWSEEKDKKDLDREPGFMERDLPNTKMRLGMIDRSYDEGVDRAVLTYFLLRSRDLPPGQRIEGFDKALSQMPGDTDGEKIDALVEKLYSGTKLADASERMRMFDLSRKDLLKEKDPFIDLAVGLMPEVKEIEEKDKAFGGSVSELRPRLIEGMKEWKGGAFYPDANRTMRLTFGKVAGYIPRDAVRYEYITSLYGAIEKNTGEEPFDCPAKLIALQAAGDFDGYVDEHIHDVPIAFLATCDITGGNSGSPILNGKGEVVGAAFDGNWESISADYLFNEDLTRTISVESRYILFILDKFSGARKLLDELTIH